MTFSRTCAILLALACAWTGGARAQSWNAATGPAARLGLVTIACKGEFCLGVGCAGGAPEFISMAPGGGPFNGATVVKAGAVQETLGFAEDPAIMRSFNMLGTRAKASAALIEAMRTEKNVTLSGATLSDRVTSTFALTGYARHAPAIAKACGAR